MTLRGFCFQLDLASGQIRQWYIGEDGIKRWMDNDKPAKD